MQEDRADDAGVDGDGGDRIAVAMESRNHGVTELRKQAAWLRINGFTNQRKARRVEFRNYGKTELRKWQAAEVQN